MSNTQPIEIHHAYEPTTGSWQYIVADPSTKDAIVIDPVLDYDAITATISTVTADALLETIRSNDYNIVMLLETHAHADHLTAANYLKTKLTERQNASPPIAIGKRIVDVQNFWARRFGVPEQECAEAFDRLLDDNETFEIGNLKALAVHLPGHTPDHMGYFIQDNIFAGDSIFKTDLGSARADFPGGNATQLFRSGRELLTLPDDVKIWSGHDYPPDTTEGIRAPFTTVREQRERNKHLKTDIGEDEFVKLRRERDATLAEPKLLQQALQINIRAGKLPVLSAEGLRMMHIPLKFGGGCHW